MGAGMLKWTAVRHGHSAECRGRAAPGARAAQRASWAVTMCGMARAGVYREAREHEPSVNAETKREIVVRFPGAGSRANRLAPPAPCIPGAGSGYGQPGLERPFACS